MDCYTTKQDFFTLKKTWKVIETQFNFMLIRVAAMFSSILHNKCCKKHFTASAVTDSCDFMSL